MATATDDAAIQHTQPHIVVGDDKRLHSSGFGCLGRALLRKENMFILRRESSWANAETLFEYKRPLATSLGASRPGAARDSHVGLVPCASQRESCMRFCACRIVIALSVGADDSMAAGTGRVRSS